MIVKGGITCEVVLGTILSLTMIARAFFNVLAHKSDRCQLKLRGGTSMVIADQLPIWFYKEVHPHCALHHRSPNEFRDDKLRPNPCSGS